MAGLRTGVAICGGNALGYFCSLILAGYSAGSFHFLNLVGVFLCQIITVLLLVGLEPVTQAV